MLYTGPGTTIICMQKGSRLWSPRACACLLPNARANARINATLHTHFHSVSRLVETYMNIAYHTMSEIGYIVSGLLPPRSTTKPQPVYPALASSKAGKTLFSSPSCHVLIVNSEMTPSPRRAASI